MPRSTRLPLLKNRVCSWEFHNANNGMTGTTDLQILFLGFHFSFVPTLQFVRRSNNERPFYGHGDRQANVVFYVYVL